MVGKRLAVTNLDWDSIGAVDLYVLFRSFCHSLGGSTSIEKVQIYPSLYGIEQMKNDALYGPPKEMFTNKRTELEVKKIEEKREYESDGDFKLDENDDGNNLA